MGFTFRKAKKENVHALLMLAGGTGSGKTYSALRLASGLAGGKRFCVIDTEAGRALHYADKFEFDHGDLSPPHNPGAYLNAIKAAEQQGYPVVVVDSISHEHAGEGGLLDMHEEAFAAKGYQDKYKIQCWIKPKMEHKRLVSKLLQLRCHLILCARAEEKTIVSSAGRGQTKVETEWKPVIAKGLDFEMTASFMLHHEAPGLPNRPLKLPEALRQAFDRAKPISESSGHKVAEWAAGGVDPRPRQENPDLSAALGMIEAATTTDELGQVATRLKAIGLTGGDLETARSAYSKRMSSLVKNIMGPQEPSGRSENPPRDPDPGPEQYSLPEGDSGPPDPDDMPMWDNYEEAMGKD